MTRSMLSDKTWEKIKPLLPPESGFWGRPYKSHRPVIEGILWVLRTGAPWRDLPSEFGAWRTCFTRFNRWSKNGLWIKIWKALQDDIDHENYSVDGSIVKAHQDACRVKKKKKNL